MMIEGIPLDPLVWEDNQGGELWWSRQPKTPYRCRGTGVAYAPDATSFDD